MKILIINGPNLNLLGRRNPDLYGYKTFEEELAEFRATFPDVEIEYFQSNHEGAIIDELHRAGFDSDYTGIVINPGAYSHYSYAIADAIEAIPCMVIEVHISNIFEREEFRHTSVTARHAYAMIAGADRFGYNLAIQKIIEFHS